MCVCEKVPFPRDGLYAAHMDIYIELFTCFHRLEFSKNNHQILIVAIWWPIAKYFDCQMSSLYSTSYHLHCVCLPVKSSNSSKHMMTQHGTQMTDTINNKKTTNSASCPPPVKCDEHNKPMHHSVVYMHTCERIH